MGVKLKTVDLEELVEIIGSDNSEIPAIYLIINDVDVTELSLYRMKITNNQLKLILNLIGNFGKNL
ncbi:MAG: hypothetical protein DDT41_01517 [candidate division WS2 bacterium]|nr:hypothetical protein [Candidatus Psychracetigena formicireducens]